MKWAFLTFWSRVFAVPAPVVQCPSAEVVLTECLVPYLDLFNHHCPPTIQWHATPGAIAVTVGPRVAVQEGVCPISADCVWQAIKRRSGGGPQGYTMRPRGGGVALKAQ